MSTKKGIDDLVGDPRYQAVEKRVQETKLQQMICFDNDTLFKEYWKGCPKRLKDYIIYYDTEHDYYESATSFCEGFLMENGDVTEKFYEAMLNWLSNLKIVCYWPER